MEVTFCALRAHQQKRKGTAIAVTCTRYFVRVGRRDREGSLGWMLHPRSEVHARSEEGDGGCCDSKRLLPEVGGIPRWSALAKGGGQMRRSLLLGKA